MRTRSQPESPSGFAFLESDRAARGTSRRRNNPQSSRATASRPPSRPPSHAPSRPPSRPATRSRGNHPDVAVEQQDRLFTSIESGQPESSQAPGRRQTRAASRAASQEIVDTPVPTSHSQSLHSVEIQHRATTKGKQPVRGRDGRRTRSNSRKTSRGEIDTPAVPADQPPTLRSAESEPESEHDATTKGKKPRKTRARRQARSKARATPLSADEYAAAPTTISQTLEPARTEPVATAESEAPITPGIEPLDAPEPGPLDTTEPGDSTQRHLDEIDAMSEFNFRHLFSTHSSPAPSTTYSWLDDWDTDGSLLTRSKTPTEPDWEDLPAPDSDGELAPELLADNLLAEIEEALALHDQQEAMLAVGSRQPAGECQETPTQEEDEPMTEGNPDVADTTDEASDESISVVSDWLATLSISSVVDDLSCSVAVLTIHDSEDDDQAMLDVVGEAVDVVMGEAEPVPHPTLQQMPGAEVKPVVDVDVEMVDAIPLDVVPGPRMEPNSILDTSFNIVARLGCPPAPTTFNQSVLDPEVVRLTEEEASRKRDRSDGAGDTGAPEAKRRRNLPVTPLRRGGVQSPVPFTLRPWWQLSAYERRLVRPASLGARERRRRVESHGHIHKSLFRLPEYVAQAKAETERTPVPEEQPAKEPQPKEAPPPETPLRRGWSIRGLLSSIPRPSLSRFIPMIRQPAQEPEVAETSEAREVATEVGAPETAASQQPSNEDDHSDQADREVSPESEAPAESPLTEADIRYRKKLEEYERNLHHFYDGDDHITYSYYPPPWNPREYLQWNSKSTRKTTSKSSSKTTSQTTATATTQSSSNVPAKSPSKSLAITPESSSKTTSSHSSNITSQAASDVSRKATSDVTPVATAQSQSAKKRKRAPSPDVIPNPPGCSYGMDLDYFYYTDESDEADSASENEISPSKNTSVATKSAIRNANSSSQLPPSKKVRFDASPQDSPSKTRRRPCATDPYTGRHFLGIGEKPYTPPTEGLSTHQAAAAPPELGFSAGSPQDPTAALRSDTDISQGTSRGPIADPRSDSRPTTSPGPIAAARPDPVPSVPTSPRSSATIRPDPSRSHAVTSPEPIAGPRPDTAIASTPSSAVPQLTQPTAPSEATGLMSDRSPSSRPTPHSVSSRVSHPLTPQTPTKDGDGALAKVRSQVEKFKPKTPSGLRTASRYSSPLTITPDTTMNRQLKPDFGDDEFGRDAEWLYEQCPTGNLETLVWPFKENITATMDVDSTPRQLLTRTWNNLEADEKHSSFQTLMEDDLIE